MMVGILLGFTDIKTEMTNFIFSLILYLLHNIIEMTSLSGNYLMVIIDAFKCKTF